MKSYRTHIGQNLVLAIPICLSQLGHIMVGIVDTAMVGMIGTGPQAAVSLANSFYTIVLVFGIGISFSITPLAATYQAEGNVEGNTRVLKNGLILNVLTGIILFVILKLLVPGLRYLDQPKEVVDIAIPFLQVMVLSLLPLSIFSTYKQFAEGLSDTKAAMIISIGANLLNVLLNYLMIFGKWGFPEMGFMGACWATFISRVIMAATMYLYYKLHSRFKVYRELYNSVKVEYTMLARLLKLGIPTGLQFVFEVGAFSFAAIMVGWIGKPHLAAHQIALSMAAATYMIASGISAAATVRVGHEFGLKEMHEVKRAGFTSFIMVGGFMILSALVFIQLSDYLPLFFTHTQQVVGIASGLLVIAAIFQLSDGLQVAALGALRGLKDVRIPMLIALISYWVIALPCSYLLAFKLNLGINGVWYGLSIGLSVAAILLIARFIKVSSRKI